MTWSNFFLQKYHFGFCVQNGLQRTGKYWASFFGDHYRNGSEQGGDKGDGIELIMYTSIVFSHLIGK